MGESGDQKDKTEEKGRIIMKKKKFDREEAISLIARGEMDRLLDFDLHHANLRDANLRDADLCGADLRDANLRDANLRDANLRDANLRDANLRDANLCGADLCGADLRGANLCGANLCGADLCGADLRDANLCGANIDYACWPLWCGSLGVKMDVRIARQLAYHLCALDCDDPEYIKARDALLPFANQFHRVQECGILEASHG